MYVCCGDISWHENEQMAGGYRGYVPPIIMPPEVKGEETLGELIAGKLEILRELQVLLSSWEGRSQKWSPESVARLEHAQAILPYLQEYFRSQLNGQMLDIRPKLQALLFRNIQRRLHTLKFCGSHNFADRLEFFHEVDCLFSELDPDMAGDEERSILYSVSQSVPALASCYKALSREFAAINKTISRGLFDFEDEMWTDAPGHFWEQSGAEPQNLNPGCKAVLAVAIFLGYNGHCDCWKCRLNQKKQNSQGKMDSKPKSNHQRSGATTAQVKDQEEDSQQKDRNDEVLKMLRKAGIWMYSNLLGTTLKTNDDSARSSISTDHSTMHQRKTTNNTKLVSCLGCKPTSLIDWTHGTQSCWWKLLL